MAEFDVQQWLRMLRLEEYSDQFKSNGYRSFEDLTKLTRNDLRRLGVHDRHRDKLLGDVDKLKGRSREAATQELLVSV